MRHSHQRRAGFSLVECLAAMLMLGLAGAALLLTVNSAVDSGQHGLRLLVARGLAEQLLDEICQRPYKEKGGAWNDPALGPEAGEVTRSLFDDLDDYHNYSAAPPADGWGVPLGSEGNGPVPRHSSQAARPELLAQWRISATVVYVVESNPTTVSGVPTGSRRVRVTVDRQVDQQWTEVLHLERVVSYVPGVAS